MQPYVHITTSERDDLRIKLSEGKSYRQIARELGRNVSTISREMKRNGNKDGSLTPWRGTSLYLGRRKGCRRKYRLTAGTALYKSVQEGLGKYWSPEIIVAKWKEQHPGEKLSPSTLYRALREKRIKGCTEREHLYQRGKRKFYSIGNQGRNPVKPVHSIHDRPVEIEQRQRFGDWEGDTIRGGLGKGYIFTCIDRKSRYLTLALMPGKRTALETKKAVLQALAGLPVHSLTLDNGTEFAAHAQIEEELGSPIFFADPSSPWQRGSNENINARLRFFFPKGSDFRLLSQQDIDSVALLLNQRPRKCLGGLSPADFLSKCCT